MNRIFTASAPSRWFLISAIVTGVAGTSLSVFLQQRIAQNEIAAIRLTAQTLKQNTVDELTRFAGVLESVRALHTLSDAVNQAAMSEFIEKGMIHQHEILGPFGLAQRITPPVRLILEEEASQNQSSAYRVVEPGPDGIWISAGPRPFYYPLTWQSRKEGLGIPVGLDFNALGEEVRQTIRRIEQTRRTTLVPVPAGTPGATPGSYWVFSPVSFFASDTVIGFAVAELIPEEIVRRVARRSAVSAGTPRLILTPASGAPAGADIRMRDGSWLIRDTLQALDTEWSLDCSIPAGLTGRSSTAALLAGVIITALMTALLLILGERTHKIEMTVRRRTEELRAANQALELSFAERSHLEAEINELAARERRKIGRDLHDSLGQKLTGAVFISRSLMEYFKQAGPEPLSHARTLNETLKDAVAQVRSMARGLDPVALSNENLCEALTGLADEMTGLYGISCRIAACEEPAGMNRKTKEQLYLLAREAVNNAGRHAGAGTVSIQLTSSGEEWKLRVEDDGCGIPEPAPAGTGMGIRIMRHRAALAGGRFTIASAPGKGTAVEAAGPISSARQCD